MIEPGSAGVPRASVTKYRWANIIAKSKARPIAIPSRITFGRVEGGFRGGCTKFNRCPSSALRALRHRHIGDPS